MKIINPKLFVAFLVFPLISVAAQDRAVFNSKDADHPSVGVFIKGQADPLRSVVAALYSVDGDGKRRQIKKIEKRIDMAVGSDVSNFNIEMPSPPSDDLSYVVSVFEFPTTVDVLSYELPVGKLLTTSVSSTSQQCKRGLNLRLNSVDYSEADWEAIYYWINGANKDIHSLANIDVTLRGVTSRYPLRSARALTLPALAKKQNGLMLICLDLEPELPTESYDAKIAFNKPPRVDLQRLINGKALAGVAIPPVPTLKDDNGVPGSRDLTQNLDFGFNLSSSVGEKTRDDGSKYIGRTTRGTFDLRLAPVFKGTSTGEFARGRKWFRYFTPAFIDAAVSTGKIDKDTLSLNRVYLGTQYEWRYYDYDLDRERNTVTNSYITYHRLIVTGKHASDRDFKQKEFLATFEYQPVFGSWNHPLYLNWRFDKAGSRVPGRFGYEIIPTVGFTIGKTYSRRNPAEVVKPSETARRFHFGLDMTFSLTRFVQISVKDTMYIRGEAEDDRLHNYFKGTFEAPLGRPFTNSVNSLFVTFERGQQPPFATRDANVVKVGYRIRSAGWGNPFK